MHPDDYKLLPIPSLPPTQCLSTDTFKQPPLDGTLSLPEIYDWHLEHSPNHPLFVYADDAGIATTIYWPEAVRAVHRAGRLIQSLVQDADSKRSGPLVIAILAPTDFIAYFTLMVGIIRAGHVAFPVSPRNSPAAIAHLLTITDSAYLLVGPEVAMQDLAAVSLKILSDAGTPQPIIGSVPPFESLYPKDSEANFEPLPPLKPKWDDIAVIMHSSGSTAYPKSILWSHHRFLMLGMVPYHGERDLTGQHLGCHSLPMYHGMGMIQAGWSATSGLVLTTFKPQSPAPVPTPESVLKGSMATKTDVIFCVPSFIESWAKDPENVRQLRQIQGLLYGGGPLSQSVGDFLVEQGVSIFILYGCTECGIVTPIIPKSSGKDWIYFRIPAGIETRFIWDVNGNAELVILPGKYIVPCKFNTVIDGIDAYATSDLLTPHPTKPGFWKVYGRADDQIMHNTGEKTNPGPLEAILNQDPHVRAAVMFGRGRFYAGVVIDPRPGHEFDPQDQDRLSDFRNKIWPTVERMNEFAPQHSRIFKEMIMVASPTKPFQYTAKNTARRQAIIADYDPEIEALYAAVKETTQADMAPPPSWSLPDSINFVKEVVNRVMKHEIQESDDIFQKGCDSLQATWIRNSLLHALRDTTKVNTRSISSGFVYQYPSIGALAGFLSRIAGSEHSDLGDVERVHSMLKMVERYSDSLFSHAPSTSSPLQDTVVLTGTTGGLGATLLAHLVASPAIGRVYALNRHNHQPLKERQRLALQLRGFDESIVNTEKIVLVETDLEKERMGLSPEVYEEIRISTTHVIHNAWPVNFNLSLSSFEVIIKGVRALIDLALSSPLPSPPRLVFISSIGVLRNLDPSGPIAEEPVEARVAVGMGYSESKWVAEKLLSVVASKTTLRPVTVRVGQVTGGRSGAWNQAEWFPSLVKSSVNLGCLPVLPQEVSWIPADSAARAIIEMRNSPVSILHLAHPRPVTWETIMEGLSKELDLPSEPYTEWLRRLKQKGTGVDPAVEAENLGHYPALKILDFFARAQETLSCAEAMGIPRLDVSEATRVAPTLQKLAPLTSNDTTRWLAYWRSSGFL
ncbi:unnamed protein product [Somion occarium]|uniref:Acetyl-CoA synthetase-like protein n=1 Tax=Somion occarium TaxID=3059160 RepID=A0ABP1CWX5_9APHY